MAASVADADVCMHHTHAYRDSLSAPLQAQDRGKAFGGVLLFSGSVGGMIGSLYATNLGKASKQ